MINTLLATLALCALSVGDTVTVDNINDDDSDHTATVIQVKEGNGVCKVRLDDGLTFKVAEGQNSILVDGKWMVSF